MTVLHRVFLAGCCMLTACFAASGVVGQTVVARSSHNIYRQRIETGQAAAAHGDVAAARAAFQEAMRLEPNDAQAIFESGVLAAGLGDVREAESLFRRCTQLDPGFARGHYMLGLALIADPATRLDWPGALQQFRTALRLQPVYPEASARLGQGLLALNESVAAIEVLRVAATRSPSSAMLQSRLGQAYETAQRVPEAMAAYRRAIAIDPRESDSAVAMAKLLISSGHAGDAAEILRATLRWNPDLQAAQYVFARALKQLGRTEAANSAFAASAQLARREPDSIEAKRLSNAALTAAAQGHLDEAEKLLHQSIQLRPDYGIAHYNLGLIFADQMRYLDAQYQLIQAVSLLPGQAKPLFDLARVERLLGNGEGAQRERQWALRIDPALGPQHNESGEAIAGPRASDEPPALPSGWSDTVSAHQQLAADLAGVGDYLGAVGQLLRAVQLAPARADLRVVLSREFTAAGDPASAGIEYHDAQLIEPTLPPLR